VLRVSVESDVKITEQRQKLQKIHATLQEALSEEQKLSAALDSVSMGKVLKHFDSEKRNLKAEVPRLREASSLDPDLRELNDMILGEC
jgi:hypothetical protein